MSDLTATEDDIKLAALAVRELPEWKSRALTAEAKVAEYKRKERVAAIYKKAEAKGARLPSTVDLTKVSEEDLAGVERSLDMMTPRGEIQLGAPESEGPGPDANTAPTEATQARRDLNEYLAGYTGR